MDFALDDDQRMMREMAERISRGELEPRLAAHPADAPMSRALLLELFAAVRGAGLLAPRLPEADGGAGLRMLDYGLMLEPVPAALAISLIAHEGCIARLYSECTPAQKARLLPPLIAGEAIGCTGSTEPDAGSDPRAVQARLHRKGDRLLLSGRKLWITNGSVADVMIVTCRDQREGSAASTAPMVKVVAERARMPFEAREIDTIGLRQGLLAEIVFDDYPVEPENVIEAGTGATEVLKATWSVNRPLIGLVAVGLAQRAFDMALDYSRLRRQFGKPIAGHQLVQKALSDAATAIESSRLLCHSALAAIDRGEGSPGRGAMAKRHAQNACQEAIWQSMNLLGATGLAVETGIERLYRDVRMLAIPDGTNEILALIHGRELTGLEALRGTPTRPS
jgi:alkylation response protein AidB-like acyl-CoA dehydrogenase